MSTVASLACTTAPVSTAAHRTNQHLIASIYHPLSAPNQANTSGEFKPLTSQKFLCNNRLGFWWFNSILVLWRWGVGGECRGAGGCQGPEPRSQPTVCPGGALLGHPSPGLSPWGHDWSSRSPPEPASARTQWALPGPVSPALVLPKAQLCQRVHAGWFENLQKDVAWTLMGRNRRCPPASECFCLGQRRQRTLGGTGEGCEERRGQQRRYLHGGKGRTSISPGGRGADTCRGRNELEGTEGRGGRQSTRAWGQGTRRAGSRGTRGGPLHPLRRPTAPPRKARLPAPPPHHGASKAQARLSHACFPLTCP